MKIGVLGVGALAEYLIRGALSDPAGDWPMGGPDEAQAKPPLPSSPTRGEERPLPLVGRGRGGGHLGGGNAVDFLLSPRSEERVARLGLPVAGSNQEVVDGCDAVLVCLPARAGLGVLRGLRFRAGQTVCSAMAGVGLEALAEAVAPARACVAMMPGYANAYGLGPSVLYPADPVWAGFLSRVGPVHGFGTAEEFETAAVFGAMSGASVVFLQHLAGWFAAQGLEPNLARRLVAETLRGNAEVLLRSEESLDEIVKGVATPGGITEQLVAGLQARGALAAWDEGMDAVLARMTGRGE